MNVILTIRDDSDEVYSMRCCDRRAAHAAILSFVRDHHVDYLNYHCANDLDGAIEFLTLHGYSVRILEYYPAL
jgi:hypothetical protein